MQKLNIETAKTKAMQLSKRLVQTASLAILAYLAWRGMGELVTPMYANLISALAVAFLLYAHLS